ncbi:MAG TPA: MFS transporter [Candidatus Corynebacterium avicola]|uniref:MFS transporter n=1 Tax=Candidatus Corynebacterium avicola TaxID=2838527 RepID=A0A9D1RNQ1_9CORY|nr:MFS transporter [Candidatus Corynebacterium avicola]
MSEHQSETSSTVGLGPGDPGYRRVMVAAAAAGLASFNAMYLTQALLPSIHHDLGISPTTAALTVSATTGMLALAVIPVSIISERVGRRRVLQVSVLAATVLSLVLALAPGIETLIVVRALQGIAVAGVPAVMMSFLSEEIRSEHLGRVMGLYIAGTTLGGLLGRLIPSGALGFTGWRGAVLIGGLVAFAIAALCAWALPKQRNFTPKRITVSHELAAFRHHWRNPSLVALFILPFLMMGAFVSLYNYLGFRLTGEFGLPEVLAGMVFILYLSGTWSSARAGALVAQYGVARVLIISCLLATAGLLLALIPNLAVTVVGVLIYTASFFAVHSTASTLVGQLADRDRAEASSTYVMSYYMGSSVVGWLAGFIFDLGWGALIGGLVVLQVAALGLCMVSARGAKKRSRK